MESRPTSQAPDCLPPSTLPACRFGNRAFPSWKADETVRRQAIKNFAAVIRSHTEELAKLFTCEQGRTFRDTKWEVEASAGWLDEVADMKHTSICSPMMKKTEVEVRRKPFGVVGAITPWNFPILLAVAKIAPALLLGNTMVLKPSPFTPLTTLRIGEFVRDILPAGVSEYHIRRR